MLIIKKLTKQCAPCPSASIMILQKGIAISLEGRHLVLTLLASYIYHSSLRVFVKKVAIFLWQWSSFITNTISKRKYESKKGIKYQPVRHMCRPLFRKFFMRVCPEFRRGKQNCPRIRGVRLLESPLIEERTVLFSRPILEKSETIKEMLVCFRSK